jgi:hypothetical protein
MERGLLQKLEKPESSASMARSTRPHDLRHVNILLIDDDPQAQALIEMALIDAHFERKIEVAAVARCTTAKNSCANPRRWRRSDGSQAGWPTTSTIC